MPRKSQKKEAELSLTGLGVLLVVVVVFLNNILTPLVNVMWWAPWLMAAKETGSPMTGQRKMLEGSI